MSIAVPGRLGVCEYADEGLLSVEDPGERDEEGLKKLSPAEISDVSLEIVVEGWDWDGRFKLVGGLGYGEERG